MVKGYEFAKDQYVTFTPEELKALEEKATQTIEIAEFVPPRPDRSGLLRQGLLPGPREGRREGVPAAVRGDARDRPRGPGALRGARQAVPGAAAAEHRGRLVMQQLLYADEVRPFSEVPMPDGEVREPELKLAKQLIDQIAVETFEPTKYDDDVRERIQADIERKVQGQDIAVTAPEPEPARIIDLMEALKASLGKGERPPAGRARGGHSAAAAEAQTPRRGARGRRDRPAEPKRAKKRRRNGEATASPTR